MAVVGDTAGGSFADPSQSRSELLALVATVVDLDVARKQLSTRWRNSIVVVLIVSQGPIHDICKKGQRRNFVAVAR